MELQNSKLHVGRVRCPCNFKLQTCMSVVYDVTSDFQKSRQSCKMPMELRTSKLRVGRVRCPWNFNVQTRMSVV
eukprot:245659-Pyramimonas_sp.AAC.1